MPEITHAQRMRQKEQALWHQVREQLAMVGHPSTAHEEPSRPEADIAGVVTVTAVEQDAIRAWLRGLG